MQQLQTTTHTPLLNMQSLRTQNGPPLSLGQQLRWICKLLPLLSISYLCRYQFHLSIHPPELQVGSTCQGHASCNRAMMLIKLYRTLRTHTCFLVVWYSTHSIRISISINQFNLGSNRHDCSWHTHIVSHLLHHYQHHHNRRLGEGQISYYKRNGKDSKCNVHHYTHTQQQHCFSNLLDIGYRLNAPMIKGSTRTFKLC